MANKISLTPENIKYLRYAFAHFFPEDAIYSADKPYISGEFNWKDRRDFIDFVYRLTGISIKSEKDFANIKKAELAVEELASESTGGEKPTESNMPDKVAREQQEAERLKREIEIKETQKNAQKNIEEALRKKQEIYEKGQQISQVLPKEDQINVLNDLKDKVFYAVPATPPPKINFTQAEAKIIEVAKDDAQLFSEKLSELIVQKNPDIPQEVLQPLSKIIAVDATRSLTNPAERPTPPGVFAALTVTPNKIPEIKTFVAEELKKTTSVFTTFSESQDDLYRTVLKRSLGENITNYVLGFQNQEYVLSETPTDTGFTIKIDQLQENSFTFQESPLYESINSPPTEIAKSFVGSSVKDFALDKVKSISNESALSGISKFANSKTFDSIAPFLGVQTNFTYAGTGFFGKTITTFFPEYAPLITNISEKLGINVGIKAISPVVTKAAEKAGAIAAGTAVGKAVATVAAKTGLKAAITATGQALGSFAPIVGNILAFIGTEIIGKIIEKIPWEKVKKYASYVIGAILGVGAFAIAGPVIGIVVGLGSYGLASAATGGAINLGTIGANIGRFFATLGGAVLVSIGTPVLITLLVFPVVVAIILFIVNSGAYVIPPTSEVFGGISSPYIEITKTPDPPGPFTNNELPKTVNYNITIKAKKGVLSNVNIKYDCQVTSSLNKNCPSTSDIPSSVNSISPSLPYTFSYTSTYDKGYNDSSIIDTITITADVAEKSGVTAETSASVTFGSPPISCPLPAGKPVNSMNYSYNPQTNTGHGSTTYWNAMGGAPYRYSIPQWTGCRTPDSCPYYGYAYDVFPNGIKTVYAPTVLGKNTTWNLSATFSNGAAGYTVMYADTTGSYMIVLTHVASTNAPKTVSSGTKVATLFNQGTNTHLHIEFQVNGRWVKPENYFCK